MPSVVWVWKRCVSNEEIFKLEEVYHTYTTTEQWYISGTQLPGVRVCNCARISIPGVGVLLVVCIGDYVSIQRASTRSIYLDFKDSFVTAGVRSGRYYKAQQHVLVIQKRGEERRKRRRSSCY